MAKSTPDGGAADRDSYALRSAAGDGVVTLPELPYRPLRPVAYRPAIGLIGCGGIAAEHLTAYRNAGYQVVAFADVDVEKARLRRDDFYPDAEVYANPAELLGRSDVDVVDIATHPAQRASLIADALTAGKHVLSQKPFVLDLDVGERLCEIADRQGVRLAVNQNGRWAPYVSWMRLAIEQGLIGDVTSVDAMIAWDHTWIEGTPFQRIPHVILYDFAVHWFDMLHCYTRGKVAALVTAQVQQVGRRTDLPPLSAQALVAFDDVQASLVFRGATPAGQVNSTFIAGTDGALESVGPSLEDQTVTLFTSGGKASPSLVGKWFPDGFDGAMSELLVAIEQDRAPYNSGRDNLESLAMCFAAMQSASQGKPAPIGSVRRVEPAWVEAAAP